MESVLFKTKGKIMRNFYFRPLAGIFAKRSAAIYYLCSWSGFLLGDKLRPLKLWGLRKCRKPLCRLRFFLKTPAKVGGRGTEGAAYALRHFFGGAKAPPYRKIMRTLYTRADNIR